MKLNKIRKLVVHVSDSPDDIDLGVKEIKRWHTDPVPQGNGWADIGYHWVIRRSGKIEVGRPKDLVGAHVKGHNSDSLGICWVGKKIIAKKQYVALLDLLTELMEEHGLNLDNVVGHTELDPKKTCPNLDMDKVRAELAFHKITKNLKDFING